MSLFTYEDYIKCGVILLAPSLKLKDQYILKCSDCNEYYCQLEPFIEHWNKHYGIETSTQKIKYYDNNETEIKSDIAIKSEDVVADYEKLDPLTFADEEEEVIEELDVYDEGDDGDMTSRLHDAETTFGYADEETVDESHDEEQSSENQDENITQNMESDIKFQGTKDVKLSIFVRNFMKSETNVTCFISAYRNQPHLWDNELSSHVRSQQRPTYLKEIAVELQEELQVNLSLPQVSAIIAHLRYRYRNRLRYLKSADSQENSLQPIWYFEQLKFLPYMENDSISSWNPHEPELQSKQIIQILEIYQRFPYLWNSNLIENCCTNKRQEALEKMRKVIEGKMGLKFSELDLKNYINAINVHCSKEKRIDMGHNKAEYRSEYYKYMKFLYDHVAPFKCNECNRALMNPLKLKVHKARHDGSIPLTCTLCKKGYYKTEPYIAHIRRHMDDLNVECPECGKRFLRTAEMRVHMRCHTGVKPYCCEICGFSFRHSNAFVIHKRRHMKQYLHRCPVCSKGFYAKDELQAHVDTHKLVRDLLCKICGKAYKTKSTLIAHELTHEKGRTHPCKLCGKMFKNRIGVYQHMRTHRNKDPDLSSNANSVLKTNKI